MTHSLALQNEESLLVHVRRFLLQAWALTALFMDCLLLHSPGMRKDILFFSVWTVTVRDIRTVIRTETNTARTDYTTSCSRREGQHGVLRVAHTGTLRNIASIRSTSTRHLTVSCTNLTSPHIRFSGWTRAAARRSTKTAGFPLKMSDQSDSRACAEAYLLSRRIEEATNVVETGGGGKVEAAGVAKRCAAKQHCRSTSVT